ncbi:hypothetical protein CVO_04700 [Sulfurimonas sp. CVO]|uniref:hypothetical protein n=1 Tax=Sulfurimonas sp. CVO TaxID=2283483 RepID=UPI00132EABE2|nr:hypothetical protein [Sulfurimonas sp. CVO]QHG91180.1 hypothetical protein CVO_04700 [Sulfurimonas sp. CVO]
MKIVISMFFTFTLLFSDYASDAKKTNEIFNQIPLSQILRTLTSEASKSLPMRVDRATRLRRVYSHKNTLTYAKELDIQDKEFAKLWNRKQQKTKIIDVMQQEDRQVICNELIMGNLIRNKNLIVQYTYDDVQAHFLFSHKVDKKTCKKIK